jgi:asparagine synthase (glutamine-hydrolysing)
MCGIAGIFRFEHNGANYHSAIGKMSTALAHRGPDGDGIYTQEEDGIYLGHRRLSIIDLSAKASQPMWDHTQRYLLIFNGEIYNYQEIKNQIRDYPFQTHSDSEVILAAYALWGPDCVKQFNGIFTLAIWDTIEKKLFVARDQLGIKPLYYFTDQRMFMFASELRGLLASGLIEKNLNPQALSSYLRYQSTVGKETLFRKVYKLKAGTYLLIQQKSVSQHTYWKVTDKKDLIIGNEKQIRDQVREQVFTAVHRQMISDVPIGAFLSGGIDSSIIVACMAQSSEQSINTFTVTFAEEEFNESQYARLMADRYRTNHQEILVQPSKLVERIPDIVRTMDNPSGDGINSYIVSEAIKHAGLKVALSGLGGDELFAGYKYFKTYKQLAGVSGWWSISKPVRQIMAAGISLSGSNASGKLEELLLVSEPTLSQVYPILRSVFQDNEIRELQGIDHVEHSSFEEQLNTLEKTIASFPHLSQFSIGDMLGYTEGVLLKDSDQMSMANSIELRVPFFDVDLVEYALSIPDQLKNPVTPKKILVDSFADVLPKEIWNRKKMGFTFPWALWMRNELQSFCDTALHRLNERNIFQPGIVDNWWKRFMQGDPRATWARIWTLVVLESWIEEVLD